MFVATSILCCDKTRTCVSRDKTFVATKMILVATPANDTPCQDITNKMYIVYLYLSPQESQDSKQDDTIVIYNRVPKTGSTSFAGIVYELCKSNKFNVIHINITKNAKTLALSDQVSLSTIIVVVVVVVDVSSSSSSSFPVSVLSTISSSSSLSAATTVTASAPAVVALTALPSFVIN